MAQEAEANPNLRFEDNFEPEGFASFNADTRDSQPQEVEDRARVMATLSANKEKRAVLHACVLVSSITKLLATVVLFFCVLYNNTMLPELQRRSENGKFVKSTLYIPQLLYLPSSLVTMVVGYALFKSYPYINEPRVKWFIGGGFFVVLMQLVMMVMVFKGIRLTFLDQIMVHALSILDAFCFGLIKIFYKHQTVPDDSPRVMEMVEVSNQQGGDNDSGDNANRTTTMNEHGEQVGNQGSNFNDVELADLPASRSREAGPAEREGARKGFSSIFQ